MAKTTKDEEPITSMYELLEALEEALLASDPEKRKALAETMDAYHDDFPEEFHWAVGASAPALLHHLMMSIRLACRREAQPKPHTVVRLFDRKPEGSA